MVSNQYILCLSWKHLHVHHPFVEITYYVPLFYQEFPKCNILPILNDLMFLSHYLCVLYICFDTTVVVVQRSQLCLFISFRITSFTIANDRNVESVLARSVVLLSSSLEVRAWRALFASCLIVALLAENVWSRRIHSTCRSLSLLRALLSHSIDVSSIHLDDIHPPFVAWTRP